MDLSERCVTLKGALPLLQGRSKWQWCCVIMDLHVKFDVFLKCLNMIVWGKQLIYYKQMCECTKK